MIKRNSPSTGTATKTKSDTKKNGTAKNGTVKNGTAKNGTHHPGETVKVTFVLPADAAPGKVSVLGDFNGWDPHAHPLKKRSNGTRSVSIELPAGTTAAFKYLDESGRWFCDPDHPDAAVNEYGETNSIVTT